jgi:hypothetical protein
MARVTQFMDVWDGPCLGWPATKFMAVWDGQVYGCLGWPSSEHRAAPAAAPVHLELVATDAATAHLEVITELKNGSRRGLEEQVLELVTQGATFTRAKLRDSLGVKNERLGEVLASLERTGRIGRTPAGWRRLD